MAIIAAKKETKKKICPVCKKEKSIATGFYKSSSPLFALDGCVPICIDCVKNDVVNEDGTVNENKLKTMCQRLDKPFYSDELDSAFLQAKSEHGYLSDDEIATISQNVNESITKQTYTQLSDASVGEKVAHIAIDHVAEKLSIDGAQELLAGLGGAMRGIGGMAAGLFGGNIVARFLGMLREPAEHFLANNINTMLKNNGEDIVSNMVGGEVEGFLNKPVCKLLEGHDDQLKQAVNTVESIYRSTINDHLPKILESIDISKIVRERINEMDVNETEKLIFQVMDKELKAIVWLGALLGLVMGSLNCLIF